MPLGGLALALALALTTPASAQERTILAQAEPEDAPATKPSPKPSNIEEIVVLGTESDSAGDFSTADSVTGFGAEDLAALGAKDIADIASFTPNLEIVTAGATTPTFFIRGVGLNDFNPNSTGAVAVYQDDVPINAPAIQLGSLFDVEAVNVLRGPQGTGLARNASAGAIKLYARKPSGEFGGFLRSDVGNFDLRDFEGALEAPIYEDILSGRFAFRLSQRNGTMKNRCAVALPDFMKPTYPGPVAGTGVQPPWSMCGEPVDQGQISQVPYGLEPWVNNIDNWAARGTLLFQPTLDMSWLVNAHGSKRDEITRLGQSIGTAGNYCINGAICEAPFTNVPQWLRGRRIDGWLGGVQNGSSPSNSYRPREISWRLFELSPCFIRNNCRTRPLAERVWANHSKLRLSDELASGLDSKPWEGDFNHTGPTRNETWGSYVKGDVALPFGIQLKTTSAVDTYDRIVDIDLDFSPETLFHITTDDEGWQVYQDVSFSGQLGHESPLRWELGGWFLREVLDVVVSNDFGELQSLGIGERDYTQKLWSAAGYGTFSFDFWGKFTLDGGVRWNYEQKELDMLILPEVEQQEPPPACEFDRAVPGLSMGSSDRIRCLLDETWSAPTGTIRLTYRFREDTAAFWKYTRGWKPGTFNATASQYTGPTVAKPEELDSFEAGLRGSWFDGRVRVDASAFYYSYKDYQIFTAQQFLGGNPEFVILNANDAEVYGAEIDAMARPWANSFFNVRFSWLESQFLDFLQLDQVLTTGPAGFQVVFQQRQNSGNPLLNSPRFKVSLTGEQTVPLGRYGSVTLRYDGVWSDRTYYDASRGVGLPNQQNTLFLPNNTISQDPFWLHNLRLSWRAPNGRFEVAAWVRNLENKAYKSFAFDGSTFRNTTIYFVGDPRTFGLSTVINF